MRLQILAALTGLLTLSLAACQPQGLSIAEIQDDAPGADAVTASANCTAKIEKPWLANGATHTVEATTAGPGCAQAVVTLTVRGPDGAPELAWSARTQDIFGLYDAADPDAMKTALADWIDQSHSMFNTTSALPAWDAGKQAPGAGNEEFPFHAEGWLDRDTWEQLRKDNAPLFVFPQGRESQAVFLLRDGQLEPIGVQQFPG